MLVIQRAASRGRWLDVADGALVGRMFYTRACFNLLVEALRRERSSVRPARAAATVIPSAMSSGPTTVIQVTNLSAAVTSDQMRTLFSFLGDVEELRLYPPE